MMDPMEQVRVGGSEKHSPSKTIDVVTGTTPPGVGKLLYSISSKHRLLPFCQLEETSLEFREHVIVAKTATRLWCFPKRYHLHVIPRFKITSAEFTQGPKAVSKMLLFLIIVIGALLITFGSIGGGCSANEYSYSYSSYSSYSSGVNSGACSGVVFGALVIAIGLPIAVILPWIKRFHYIYLTTKTASSSLLSRGYNVTTAFRFKKDHKLGESHDNTSSFFDEAFLVDYVYGPLGKVGNKARDETHVLAHYNDSLLATPLQPIYSDCIQEILPKAMRKRPNGTNGNYAAEATATSALPPHSPHCVSADV